MEPDALVTKPAAQKFETNRVKALISMNVHLIFVVFFVQSNKVAINEMKTPVLDLAFLASLMLVVFTLPVILCLKRSLRIPAENRKTFSIRLVIGWLHFVVYIVGNTLIPITIQ